MSETRANQPEISIAGRRIGPAHPPYVIAEMSANHLGDLQRALAIIDAAAEAGADAIKLQTYTADTITIACERPEFHIAGGLWDGRSLHELYQQAHTPWEWHRALFQRAHAHGLAAFSAPFDATAVTLLQELDAPAYKIASFELVDHDLIANAAATGKPVIMSSGMATPGEIEEAVGVARAHGAGGVAVLHCLSGYPTPAEEFNLRRLADISSRTAAVVGISDHSPGAVVAIAAVALGAAIVEKHLTLARADGGPDAAFSLEPAELCEVVRGCRTAWAALGDGRPERAPSESINTRFRRSLYIVEDVAAGQRFTRENVRSIRPNCGLPPKHLSAVLGRIATQAIARGTPLSWELVLGGEDAAA